jgi:hypothetical protein
MATLMSSPDDNGRSNHIIDHFSGGQKDRYAPLSKHQRDMLRFTGRQFSSTVDRDHALNQKFGMTPVDYFRKIEELSEHPGLSKKMKGRVQDMHSRPSSPGPMHGGAPIYAGKQFTHGTMW